MEVIKVAPRSVLMIWIRIHLHPFGNLYLDLHLSQKPWTVEANPGSIEAHPGAIENNNGFRGGTPLLQVKPLQVRFRRSPLIAG
jgi:hypothetical protein